MERQGWILLHMNQVMILVLPTVWINISTIKLEVSARRKKEEHSIASERERSGSA